MRIIVEACVDSVESAIVAERAGASRLELCERLDVGGTTPSAELVRRVLDMVRIPVNIMIRPRAGSYVYTEDEIDEMRRQIDEAHDLGVDGLVIGMLREDDCIDEDHTRMLVQHALVTPVTFHRAFDEVPDQREAVESVIEAGAARVLTSGGEATAMAGVWHLHRLVEQAGERIVIMAGGKVRPENARAIVEQTGVVELHARSELDDSRIRGIIAAVT